ncbi:uncharacterized protein LOC130023696 [Sorex fumeus]|uniref:uncharacterized protein LOC130023696 n=1 Tax=Sorex fumeus TaxID=62283 RepID=UPI0024ADC68E|nr:uncharacterized protein LOC130023696 [Sorex fumeus]
MKCQNQTWRYDMKASSTELFLDKERQRPPVELPFEEEERRALLLKKWSLYKQQEHKMERDAIRSMLEAQQKVLLELQLAAPELYEEAIKRDPGLFPFEREGPDYTPPVTNYQPPEGRYHDITKVYTQVEYSRDRTAACCLQNPLPRTATMTDPQARVTLWYSEAKGGKTQIPQAAAPLGQAASLVCWKFLESTVLGGLGSPPTSESTTTWHPLAGTKGRKTRDLAPTLAAGSDFG